MTSSNYVPVSVLMASKEYVYAPNVRQVNRSQHGSRSHFGYLLTTKTSHSIVPFFAPLCPGDSVTRLLLPPKIGPGSVTARRGTNRVYARQSSGRGTGRNINLRQMRWRTAGPAR